MIEQGSKSEKRAEQSYASTRHIREGTYVLLHILSFASLYNGDHISCSKKRKKRGAKRNVEFRSFFIIPFLLFFLFLRSAQLYHLICSCACLASSSWIYGDYRSINSDNCFQLGSQGQLICSYKGNCNRKTIANMFARTT